MRYFASLKLNGFEVGKGYGSNKKLAKNVAAAMALKNLCPTLHKEWQRQTSVEEKEAGSPQAKSPGSNKTMSFNSSTKSTLKHQELSPPESKTIVLEEVKMEPKEEIYLTPIKHDTSMDSGKSMSPPQQASLRMPLNEIKIE
jgi:hypothetical protein